MFEDDDVDVLGAPSPAPPASQFSLFDSTQGSEAAAGDEPGNDDIARLRRALWNEKASPEILPFEEEAVEDLIELIGSYPLDGGPAGVAEHEVTKLRGP